MVEKFLNTENLHLEKAQNFFVTCDLPRKSMIEGYRHSKVAPTVHLVSEELASFKGRLDEVASEVELKGADKQEEAEDDEDEGGNDTAKRACG